MRISLPLLLVLAVAAVPARPVEAQPATPFPAARLDSIFARFAVAGSPGCAVGVGLRGDTVTRAYGLSDLEHDVRAQSATIYEAGSVSKQVTAAAVVLLALDGKLSLDDDVRRHVPELPDYGTPITLRHLLNHTSGLRDWGAVAGLGGWPRGSRVHTNQHVVQIASRQRALNHAPGAHYSYTNTGYNLLAVIVARVSGQSFADFTRERLFLPLGMTSTSWRDDYTRIVPGRAQAYGSSPLGGWRLDMPFEHAHGNGGLLTTVHDLLRFTANLESGRVGGPRFLEEMHRQGRLTSGRTISYASGLVAGEWRGLREVGHSGATAGYRAHLLRLPDRDLSVAVLCNTTTGNATALAHQVVDLAIGDAATRTADRRTQPAAVRLADSLLAIRAGTYRQDRVGLPVRLAVVNGALQLGTGLQLVPESPLRFRTAQGDLVLFDRAPDGVRAGFARVTADDSVRFEPVDEPVVDSAMLAGLAGRWTSDEVEGAVTTRVDGARLLRTDRHGNAQPMLPVYRDAFTSGGILWRVERDADGRAVALRAAVDRAWDVRFARAAQEPAAPRVAPDSLRPLVESGLTIDAWLAAARNRVDEWRAVDARATALMASDATLVDRARRLDGRWRVLVVAEDTCGDSINSVPWLARLAAAMPAVSVHIVRSAPGRGVMETFRTRDGRAATPTILLLDPSYRVVGCYIEQPAPLRAWRAAHPEATADERTANTRGFYREDAGRTVREEFLAMVDAARDGRGSCGEERR
jgi:CubicO group peptidase (beta-lactamase class C family)